LSVPPSQPFIMTLHAKCRVCYTCVRECPAKAIRIFEGQADVIPERCIGCGNCVRVCSQKAKKIISSVPEVHALLASGAEVAACVAPSFAAEFPDLDFRRFVGMVRALGFHHVNEVGFGADLVAGKMKDMLDETRMNRYISTACPAVFGHVKRYHPELIGNLVPLVSPMIALARVLRVKHGRELKTVFIGPCIAKKIEASSAEVLGEIDEVLTFSELRQMFDEKNVLPGAVRPSDFDPPHARRGSLFPIGRGLLEAAGIAEDLIEGDVISANGRANFIDATMEFSSGDVDARLLDVLCCDGCIMGSGMTTTAPLFKRRAAVSSYTRNVMARRDEAEWQNQIGRFSNLNLIRQFLPLNQTRPAPDDASIRGILSKMGKSHPGDELNCGACGYDKCREHAVAIHEGLAESEMCLPYSIEQLHQHIGKLNEVNKQLASTREALIQSEKLASMGQLAAGIAHEVNNPLGVVLMYAHLLRETAAPNPEMVEDLQMIVDHADRAKKIVSGLLHFARQNKVVLKSVQVRKMVEDCIKTFHLPKSVRLEVVNEMKNPAAKIDRDQMIQVVTNLVTNSLTAMPNGGCLGVRTSDDADSVRISVSDTGTGIPREVLPKIFEPFFTTKKVGIGTGLGLAVTYGIVKMHCGDITVQSNADPGTGPTGTTFTITLPREGKKRETPVAV
jgi:signal transduction histidine kinase/Fe-S-cluster-containing hydrogenase component 2